MGAEQFKTAQYAATVKEAFAAAVEQAQYDHGHSGYGGTIAEKDEYVIITDTGGRTRQEANALADQLFRDEDGRIDDKWGPAGVIRFDEPDREPGWLFFGYASS